MTKLAQLVDRSLLRLSGAEGTPFLQNLITCDIEGLKDGEATFGALLTPQGKILFDFFIQRDEAAFFIDIAADQRDALLKRLTFYKLRADVTIAIDELSVFAVWDGDATQGFSDPRFNQLGARFYAEKADTNATQSDWNTHRIDCGIAASGYDFELGSAFPHDVLMDQFGSVEKPAGIDFEKGCYVGQEVVSRMKHRGTARNRLVKVEAVNDGATSLPAVGTEVMAADKTIGTMGSSVGKQGLAIVRIDRVTTALEANTPITINDEPIGLSRPIYADYAWPE